MRQEKSIVYDGCAVGNLCKGVCRSKYKDTCPALYRFKKAQRKNKNGKPLNKYTEIVV